jgi:hypothetical protein
MADIDRLPHADVVALARRARSRIRNAELDRERMTRRVMAVGVGGGAALAMGYIMGGLSQEPGAGTGGEDDPTKIAGIDIDLLTGIAATAVGVAMSGKASTRKAGELVEAAGTGILSGVAYTYGQQMGAEG